MQLLEITSSFASPLSVFFVLFLWNCCCSISEQKNKIRQCLKSVKNSKLYTTATTKKHVVGKEAEEKERREIYIFSFRTRVAGFPSILLCKPHHNYKIKGEIVYTFFYISRCYVPRDNFYFLTLFISPDEKK